MLTDLDMGLEPDTRSPEELARLEQEQLDAFRASVPPITPELQRWLDTAMFWFDPDLFDPPPIECIGVHQPAPREVRPLRVRQQMAVRAMRNSVRVFNVLGKPACDLLKNRRWTEWLRVNGCDMQTITKPGVGPLGLARVETASNGTFSFAEDSEPALLMPVWSKGEMVDLIAWRRRNPKRCWTLLGYADLVGIDAWEMHRMQFSYTHKDDKPHESVEPIMLHRTPMEWLQAGGIGIAPVTQIGADLRRELLNARHICCSDPDHGFEVKKLLLDASINLPLISVVVKSA